MSNHERFLEHNCRTYGVAITSSSKTTPKNVTSYRREILTVFNYDIKNDDILIYPKYVCETCRWKLDRCSHGLDNKKRVSEFCTMLIFNSHSDEDCFVCKNRSRKPITFSVKFTSVDFIQEGVVTNIANENTNMETIKNTLQENQFQFIREYSGKHQFVKFLFNKDVPVVFLTLNILSGFKWTLYRYQKQVLQSSHVMKKLSKLLMKKLNVEEFIGIISLAYICPGNEDFPLLMENKIGKGSKLYFFDKEKSVRVYIENIECCQMSHCSVIQTYNCELPILNNQRYEP